MELRHLRYFVAVAEELSFRRAADRLFVAQPSVSAQVRKLEEELGVRLLDRDQRSVSLTDAGTVMLSEARAVLHSAETARLEVRNACDRRLQRLRIGYMPSSLPAGVPRAIRRLTGEVGNLASSLEPRDPAEAVDAVRAERLDAAVISLPAPTTGLRVTRLEDELAVLALPASHREALSAAVRLDHIAPEQILVLPRETNRPFHDAVVAACRDLGLAPAYVEMIDGQVERLLLAIASGTGMALLPASVAERYLAPGVSFLPLEGARPKVAMGVVTRRDSTQLPTAAFLRALSQPQRSQELKAVPAPLPTVA